MTHDDTLSLTLPIASKSKARRRKIPKPPKNFYWCLAWTLFGVVGTVIELREHRYAHAVLIGTFAGLYWSEAMRIRDQRKRIRFIPWVIAYYASLIFLDLVGLK